MDDAAPADGGSLGGEVAGAQGQDPRRAYCREGVEEWARCNVKREEPGIAPAALGILRAGAATLRVGRMR